MHNIKRFYLEAIEDLPEDKSTADISTIDLCEDCYQDNRHNQHHGLFEEEEIVPPFMSCDGKYGYCEKWEDRELGTHS